MANKEQKRGNKEARKPKKAKAAPTSAPSAFIVTANKGGAGKK